MAVAGAGAEVEDADGAGDHHFGVRKVLLVGRAVHRHQIAVGEEAEGIAPGGAAVARLRVIDLLVHPRGRLPETQGVVGAERAVPLIDRAPHVVGIDRQRIGGIGQPVDEAGAGDQIARRQRAGDGGGRGVGVGEAADAAEIVPFEEERGADQPQAPLTCPATPPEIGCTGPWCATLRLPGLLPRSLTLML
jgi:hypothetical protein